MSNPYQILSLEELESNEKIITSKYKELALIWHPDKCKAPNASEMFMKIKVARDILLNPETKSEVDNIIKA